MQKLFGTDGIRGLANKWPMSATFVVKIGMAIAVVMKRLGYSSVVIGKDTRVSGYMIESALVSGFTALGIKVLLVGPIPTPAVAMLTKSLNVDLGLVLSASHNPYHDNGIKIFDSKGYKISTEMEGQIEDVVCHELDDYLVSPESIGRAYRINDASDCYIEFVKNAFSKDLRLSGLKIVLDCANGAASNLGGNILRELGAEIITLNDSPDGFNINRNCGSVCPRSMMEKVLEVNADIGLALDGDADRLVICDSNGNLIDGDQIIAALAKDWQRKGRLKQRSTVVTIMSSLSLEHYLYAFDIKVIRCGVGDRSVVRTMKDHNCNLGGEKSGHIVLNDYSSTSDGLITSLQILEIMCAQNKSVSDIFCKFVPMPQMSQDIALVNGCDVDSDHIKNAIAEIQGILGADGRVIVRRSGTENIIRIMIEGYDQTIVQRLIKDLSSSVREAIS